VRFMWTVVGPRVANRFVKSPEEMFPGLLGYLDLLALFEKLPSV
jgi:hypothetical protein